MVKQVENLLDGQLPFLSVLIKNYNDYEEYVDEKKKEREEKEKMNKAAANQAAGQEQADETS